MPSLTSRQWAEWQAYLRTFPLPHDRADINAALIRTTTARCAGAKNVKPAKLLPAYGRVTRVRKESELKAIAMGMVKQTASAKPSDHKSSIASRQSEPKPKAKSPATAQP